MFFLLMVLLSPPFFAIGLCPASFSLNCACNSQQTQIACNGINISTVINNIKFEGLLGTVQDLDIRNFGETILLTGFIQEFSMLTSLTLRYGHLKIIQFGAFINASLLQELDLRNNELVWLSGNMFTGLTSNLKRLFLDNNNIHQLLSDMENLFLTITNQITLGGNSLQCTCQLQWLTDLLNSNAILPMITGDSCIIDGSPPQSLHSPSINFTNCPDLCSLGYYMCPENSTCVPLQQNQTYHCFTDELSPTPSLVSPSPSISLFDLSPSPIESMLLDESSFDFSPSSFLSSHSSLTPNQSSLFSLPSSLSPSTLLASLSSSPLSLVPSSTPTTPPSICDSCTTSQYCADYCHCSVCQCKQQYVLTNNGNCVLKSNTTFLHCLNDNALGLLWPATTVGSIISIPCCSINCNNQCGSVTRTCLSNGTWGNVLTSGCISQSSCNLQLLLNSTVTGDSVALNQLSLQILNVTTTETLLPTDLQFISNIVLQVASLVNNSTDLQTVEAIIKTIGELLDDDHLNSWQQLSSPSESIVILFKAVETMGYNLPISANSTLVITTDNLALIVIAPSGSENGWNISSNLLGNSSRGPSSIFLPASIINDILDGQDLDGCDVRIVVSLWDIDTTLLQVNNTDTTSETTLVYGKCDWGSDNVVSSRTLMVNSVVISASFFSPNCTLNTTGFTTNVTITFFHVNNSLNDPSCSFLDSSDNSGTSWTGEGCVLHNNSTINYTICQCNHLTSFALLMSPTGAMATSQPLLIATKVGLCISIIALIISIILLFGLKVESKLNHVHRQLALALLLSQVVFLIGVDRSVVPSPDALCTVIAVLLHYLLLCTFGWELIEGIHLYLFVVKVFYNKKIVWVYYPLAWGLPLIIVGITVGINFCDYGSLHYCWITNGQGTLWAFHIPVIVVLIVNIVVLVVVSIRVVHASKQKDPDRCTFCSLLQASFILIPTLGLTWILGFFVVGTDIYSTIVEWVFFVCTTLQGISIFIIHCIINTEIRVAFLKALGCRQLANKQKSIFEFRPSMGSIATSTEQWRRRMSLGGSRRGSLEPSSVSMGMRKESTAFLMAQQLHKLDEDSQESSIADVANKSMDEATPYNRQQKPKVSFEDEHPQILMKDSLINETKDFFCHTFEPSDTETIENEEPFMTTENGCTVIQDQNKVHYIRMLDTKLNIEDSSLSEEDKKSSTNQLLLPVQSMSFDSQHNNGQYESSLTHKARTSENETIVLVDVNDSMNTLKSEDRDSYNNPYKSDSLFGNASYSSDLTGAEESSVIDDSSINNTISCDDHEHELTDED